MYKQTCFDNNTPEKVKKILESELHSNNRIRLFYGDRESGLDWNEEHNTMGYIGRSTGDKPIMILLNNNRSIGGGGILTACIVKITKNGYPLYTHPNYHTYNHILGKSITEGYKEAVYREKPDGLELIAQFKKVGQGQKYIDFMMGKKNNKS